MRVLRLAILISGRGSNMVSILNAVKTKKIPITPAVVISNRADAQGLERARRLGVATEVVQSGGFSGTRRQYDQRIGEALKRHGVGPRSGIVCLAGFMRIIGPELVNKYKNRILNIHPALLPSFPGLDAQGQAVKYGAKISGCTVHFVDSGVDTGPVILQAPVRVMEGDTAQTLSRRIIKQEHKAYPEAVRLFALGKIKIKNKTVRIS